MRGGLPKSIRRRLDPRERYGLRLTLYATAMVLVAVPFSALLFQVLAEGPLTEFDGRVADRLNELVHRSPAAVAALEAVSGLGRPLTLIVVAGVAAAFLWWRGQRRLAVFLVVTGLGGGLVDSAVKIAVDRPRPVVDHPVSDALGKSFPSGHAMSSTVVYGSLVLAFLPGWSRRVRRAVLAVAALLILLIGSSRLLLGLHFVSDVVGGYVLGLAWLAGAVAAFSIWRVEEGRRPAAALSEGVEPEAADALRDGATGEPPLSPPAPPTPRGRSPGRRR